MKDPPKGTSGGTSGSGSEYTGGAPSGGGIFYGSKYIDLTNGFIIQYGHYMHSKGEFMETFQLPKPFPTEFCCVVGNVETYISNSVNYTVAIINNSSFGFYCDDGGHHPFYWIAIGH